EYLKQFDVIFPITHGTKGEDGKLQGMLDFFDIKYVGPKTGESFICMDKVYSKMVFEKLGVNVVPYEIYDKNKQKNIPFPVIVKPANGGSSVGISKANNEQELNQAIEKANLYDSKIILEQFIKGQELECAVLEDEEIIVSEVGEIKSANEIYDYDSKYINSESQTIIPAHIPNDISNTIKETAEYKASSLPLYTPV
ncbi:MAG: ATP-grasp domain-containing protein, partial [Clostridia bacterium]|nr:ATP-grasp domain-containing protein [Clostridia bacterium]